MEIGRVGDEAFLHVLGVAEPVQYISAVRKVEGVFREGAVFSAQF